MSYINILIPLLLGLLLLFVPQHFTRAPGEAFERAKQKLRGIGLLLLGVASIYLIIKVAEIPPQTSAAKPKSTTEMHRIFAETKDESGWYLAESTHGAFSVLLPAPFDDYTISSELPSNGTLKAECVGAYASGGLKFSVVETPLVRGASTPNPDSIPAQLRKDGDKVSDVQRFASPGHLSVSFVAESAVSGSFMRYIQTPSNLIAMTLAYPLERRSDAAAFKSRFLDSLKFKQAANPANP